MACRTGAAALHFDFEWLDGEGIQGPELAATLSALRIRIGDSILTRLFDHHSKSLEDRIQVPLYPLAESLATNWWFLNHEMRSAASPIDREFRRRHSFVNGGDGYIFPDVTATPVDGGEVHLVWARPPEDPAIWGGIEYLEHGDRRIEHSLFRRACANLIESVLQRLSSLGIADTFLHQEWTAIRDADRDETEFCETAASLGWDPYDLDENHLSAMEVIETLGPVRREAVSAISHGAPTTVTASCRAIERALRSARSQGGHFRAIEFLRRKIQPAGGSPDALPPWQDGYRMARQLRQRLHLDGAPLRSTPALAAALGQDSKALESLAPADFGPATQVDGVVARRGSDDPAFSFRRSLHADGRRFLFCRALSEALCSPKVDSVLTRAPTPRQQRGRAFAAEFLAPASALRERIPGPLLHEEDLSDLSAEFGVSPFVIGHQLENHGIAEVFRSGGVRPSIA